jgi:hypothetical protein
MTSATPREVAWGAVHDALPARWTVRRATMADPLTRAWSEAARGPHPGRGKAPQTVTGTGEGEVPRCATSMPSSVAASNAVLRMVEPRRRRRLGIAPSVPRLGLCMCTSGPEGG